MGLPERKIEIDKTALRGFPYSYKTAMVTFVVGLVRLRYVLRRELIKNWADK